MCIRVKSSLFRKIIFKKLLRIFKEHSYDPKLCEDELSHIWYRQSGKIKMQMLQFGYTSRHWPYCLASHCVDNYVTGILPYVGNESSS